MSDFLADIESFLVAQGLVGDTDGWVCRHNSHTESPDKQIVIYETGGSVPSVPKDGDASTTMDQITFMIRGRGEPGGGTALRARMGSIYRALHGGNLGSDFVLVRALQSGPMSLGRDANDRPGLTWNFEAYRNRDADS